MTRPITASFRRPWLASLLGGFVAYLGYAGALGIVLAASEHEGSWTTMKALSAIGVGGALGVVFAILGLIAVVGFLLLGAAVVAGRLMAWMLSRLGWTTWIRFAMAGAMTGLIVGLIFGLWMGGGSSADRVWDWVGMTSAGIPVGVLAGLAMRAVIGVRDEGSARH